MPRPIKVILYCLGFFLFLGILTSVLEEVGFKEKPRQQVREGSTIPTFQISSNANSRQYTLMGMGLEEMV